MNRVFKPRPCDGCGEDFVPSAPTHRFHTESCGFRCGDCNEVKPVSAFYLQRGKPHGYCRSCTIARSIATKKRAKKDNPEAYRQRVNAERAAWVRQNPEKSRANYRNHRLRRFKLTPELYAEMLAAQGGVCAICKRPEETVHPRSGKLQRLAVDHDRACCPATRSCGACIRGLLCSGCNMGIGQLGDSPDRLREAAAYLDRFNSA